MLPEIGRVHPVSPGELSSSSGGSGIIGVVGFVRGRWVYCGTTRVSTGTSRVAGFTGVCFGGCQVSLGSLVGAMEVG